MEKQYDSILKDIGIKSDYINYYQEGHNKIQELPTNFTLKDLESLVSEFKTKCQAVSHNYCHKLFKRIRSIEGQYTPIESICKRFCPLWSECIQNLDNKKPGNAYYYLVEIWKISKLCLKEGVISKENRSKILELKEYLSKDECLKQVSKFTSTIKNIRVN